MSQYILGIDAGGTKTLGVLKNCCTDENWTIKLGAGSLTNDFSVASANIKEVATNLLQQVDCAANETILVCGAGGVNNSNYKAMLKDVLSPLGFQKLIITTDAKISLYGAGNGAPIIVAAIGTGSVAMRLDKSGSEKQFGGWGFVAGDQGSGAYIGRELIAALLKLYDEDNFLLDKFQSDIFISEVLNIVGRDRQTILNWLKEVTPAKFAELSPLVAKFKNDSDLAMSILGKAVAEVESLIQVSQGSNNFPVCLIGGLAKTIAPMLSDDIQSKLVSAKGDAIDGAVYLGERYLATVSMVADSKGSQTHG
ncbi:MAG: hypothetical protein GY829_08925 [Gammaproteobacteria bacterium]|nr:hypothetical protein [Gammaproteobacteria bacterium]